MCLGATFVVLAADGKVTIETKDVPKDAAERLLGEIINGAYKTVQEIAKAAGETENVGDVKTGPAPTGPSTGVTGRKPGQRSAKRSPTGALPLAFHGNRASSPEGERP